MISPLAPILQRGPSARRGRYIVPTLPGLVHHYRTPTLAGWPDEVGGVDGVHTGSPSLVTGGPPLAPTGVEYDGSTQLTSVGDVDTYAYVHQTLVYSVSWSFRWAGPSDEMTLQAMLGNNVASASKGVFTAIEDRPVGGGPRALRSYRTRGQSGVIDEVVAPAGAIVVDQLHHALITCDGTTMRAYIDGAVVDTNGSLNAVVAGSAGAAMNFGRCGGASPFWFAGQLYDIAFGAADWSAYAAALAAEALA